MNENNYSQLEQWFKTNLDWTLLNSMIFKALEAVHITNYFDKFFELHPRELEVINWNITDAAFTAVNGLFVHIDNENDSEFYRCELIIDGLAEITFIGGSGNIYMDDVTFSTIYQLKIRDQDFILYQTEFYPEMIGFIIDYEVLNSIRR